MTRLHSKYLAVVVNTLLPMERPREKATYYAKAQRKAQRKPEVNTLLPMERPRERLREKAADYAKAQRKGDHYVNTS